MPAINVNGHTWNRLQDIIKDYIEDWESDDLATDALSVKK